MGDPFSALKDSYDETWKLLHEANDEIDTLRAQLGAHEKAWEAMRGEASGLRVFDGDMKNQIMELIDRHAAMGGE